MKNRSLVLVIILLLPIGVTLAQKPVNTFKPKEGGRIDPYLQNNGVFDLLWDRSDEVFVISVLETELNLWSSDLSYYFTITAKIEERFKWKQVSKDSTIVRFTEKVSLSHGTKAKSLLSTDKRYIVFLSDTPGLSMNRYSIDSKSDEKTVYSLVDRTLGVQELTPRLYNEVRSHAYVEKWIEK